MTSETERDPNDGAQIRTRILARLHAAHVEPADACATAGCDVGALLGDEALSFEDAVGLAHVVGCSPAVFFDPSSASA